MSEKKQSVQQIKQEKRDRLVEPAPEGMSRRNFLTYLGVGSAALAAGSTGITARPAGAQEGFTGAASTPYGSTSAEISELSFTPIEPTAADELVLPEGFKYDIIRRWGEPVTSDGQEFGFNNDYVAYFPIDALEDGTNSEDGILFVNHEYVDSKWVSEYTGSEDDPNTRTPEQVAQEKEAVGASVIRVRKEGDTWEFVEDDEYNRRIDANTPIDLTGPAAGAEEVQGATEVIGTLANCSGGVTPWNTVLSCEENFQDYYGKSTPEEAPGENETIAGSTRWLSDPDTAQPPEHYGWVVEVDPFDKESKPRKHTWLGRGIHENVSIRVSESGKVVAYTGHDAKDECIYKFISSGTYDPADREANFELLSDGMLYVADFANGKWVALDYENNPIFSDNGFASQADVLVRTVDAVKLKEEEDGPPLGTPMDRCEDIEVHPETGTIYAALTNNDNHGNFHGQIIRMYEADDDAEATEFTFEIFATGGPNTGFSSPDNLAFDRNNNLWMVTDMSSSKHNKGIYETFRNNGMFVMPNANDAIRGEPVQFASGPVESEMTGPAFTPDGTTMFLAVQHPGEETKDVNEPTSTWPDGDIPKPSVVAITGFA